MVGLRGSMERQNRELKERLEEVEADLMQERDRLVKMLSGNPMHETYVEIEGRLEGLTYALEKLRKRFPEDY